MMDILLNQMKSTMDTMKQARALADCHDEKKKTEAEVEQILIDMENSLEDGDIEEAETSLVKLRQRMQVLMLLSGIEDTMKRKGKI